MSDQQVKLQEFLKQEKCSPEETTELLKHLCRLRMENRLEENDVSPIDLDLCRQYFPNLQWTDQIWGQNRKAIGETSPCSDVIVAIELIYNEIDSGYRIVYAITPGDRKVLYQQSDSKNPLKSAETLAIARQDVAGFLAHLTSAFANRVDQSGYLPIATRGE